MDRLFRRQKNFEESQRPEEPEEVATLRVVIRGITEEDEERLREHEHDILYAVKQRLESDVRAMFGTAVIVERLYSTSGSIIVTFALIAGAALTAYEVVAQFHDFVESIELLRDWLQRYLNTAVAGYTGGGGQFIVDVDAYIAPAVERATRRTQRAGIGDRSINIWRGVVFVYLVVMHALLLAMLIWLAYPAVFDFYLSPAARRSRVEPAAPSSTFAASSLNTREPILIAGPYRGYSRSVNPHQLFGPERDIIAKIVTNKGELMMRLFPEKAPQTVTNFVLLSLMGFYDGMRFYRVIPGVFVQAGDQMEMGDGAIGYVLPAEIDLNHIQGAVGMARLDDSVNPTRDSDGGRFYITLSQQPALDGRFTVFGQVIAGMDVLNDIEVGDYIISIQFNP